MGVRRDDQAGEGQSYLDADGGTRPWQGDKAGPRVVPAASRGALELYKCVRKQGSDNTPPDITKYADWRLGSYVPCEEQQVPGAAYDIGAPVAVGSANSITWYIDYVMPFIEELEAPVHVLSCILEVSTDGARWRPYTLLENDFVQLNLNGDASQPEPVGVGTYFASRSTYAAEFRSPNLLGAASPGLPRTIVRRLDQPVFEIDASAPPNPAAEANQFAPIGFHLIFDISPFTYVRLRWRHIQVDADGVFVADGVVSEQDPIDPTANGYVTIHYNLGHS